MKPSAKLVLALAAGGLILLAGHAQRGSLTQQASPKSLHAENPFQGSERAIQAGAKLYRRHCAACHGGTAEGIGKAPPLNRRDIREAPPGALFWVLRNGSARRGMPSFAHLPEPQRWQIVSYLQNLNRARTGHTVAPEAKSKAGEP